MSALNLHATVIYSKRRDRPDDFSKTFERLVQVMVDANFDVSDLDEQGSELASALYEYLRFLKKLKDL